MMRDLAAQAAFIAAHQHEPFAWGRWDCVLFTFGAVQALTGEDKLAGIPPWHDERSALKVLASLGGLLPGVSGLLTEIPLAKAMRGDIGAIEALHGPMVVVIEGVTLVGTGPNNLERVPRHHLIRAWSAGGLSGDGSGVA